MVKSKSSKKLPTAQDRMARRRVAASCTASVEPKPFATVSDMLRSLLGAALLFRRRGARIRLHAVNVPRRRGGHKFVRHVLQDQRGVTLSRIPQTAATGRQNHDPIAFRHAMPSLARQSFPRGQANVPRRAAVTIEEAPCRKLHAFIGGDAGERLGQAVANLDVLAEAAARRAGPTGSLTVLLAPEHQRG